MFDAAGERMKKARKKSRNISFKPLIADHERERVAKIDAAIMLPKKKLAISETTKQIVLNPDAALGDDGVLLRYVVNKQDELEAAENQIEQLTQEESEAVQRHQLLYERHIKRNQFHRKFKNKWLTDIKYFDEFVVLRTYSIAGEFFGLHDRREIRRWLWSLSPTQRALECDRARLVYNDLRINRHRQPTRLGEEKTPQKLTG